MGKASSMARKKKHNDALNIIKNFENRGLGPWSDLNHDVLYLVMMQLGVIDFLALSGVCKSWRSFGLSNRNSFMVSKPPMSISLSPDANNETECPLDEFFERKIKTICQSCRALASSTTNRFMLFREPMCACISPTKERECYLEDFQGRKFKTILPHSGGSTCIGLSCGYLILFHEKICDFWLVNPITRHELHFPDFHFRASRGPGSIRAILLFSPIICDWVFVVFSNSYIWFSIVGQGNWTCVSASFSICAIHALKGKIYTLNRDFFGTIHLYEMRLYPEPELRFLGTTNSPNPHSSYLKYASSGENLYALNIVSYPKTIQELNLSKMEWESFEKTGEKYAFFCNTDHGGVVTMVESSADLQSQYQTDRSGKGRFFYADMWYFFHDWLNVNLPHKG